jgi:hypothetical protein
MRRSFGALQSPEKNAKQNKERNLVACAGPTTYEISVPPKYGRPGKDMNLTSAVVCDLNEQPPKLFLMTTFKDEFPGFLFKNHLAPYLLNSAFGLSGLDDPVNTTFNSFGLEMTMRGNPKFGKITTGDPEKLV